MHKVMAYRCDQCLYSPNRVVSAKRAAQIMKDTARKDTPFLCHKGTIAGTEVVCRGNIEASGGGQLTRIAERLNYIQEIDPETMQPVVQP